MSRKEIGIGLCGFGFMGKTHLFSVRNIPFFYHGSLPFSASVVSVCASTPASSEAAAKAYGIPSFSDFDGMLADPRIDVIDICVPNTCHREMAAKAIAAGKHVLCEKPLCSDSDGADYLCDLARDSGLCCGTVFNNRYIPAITRARQIIDEGRIGRVLSFEFCYRHNSCIDPARPVGWKQQASFGGGTLADLGPHVIDLCGWLCGRLQSLSARGQIAFGTHKTASGDIWHTDADEAYYIIGQTRDGAVGTITVSKITQGANDSLTFSVWGERGALSFDLMQPNYLNYYDACAVDSPLGGVRGYTAIECVGRLEAPASGFPSVKAPVGWLVGHSGAIVDYLSHLSDGKPAPVDFSDGRYVMRVIDAARRSALELREVSVC